MFSKHHWILLSSVEDLWHKKERTVVWRCLQTSVECLEAKSPFGIDDLIIYKSRIFFDA
jgi:hypothetical protein